MILDIELFKCKLKYFHNLIFISDAEGDTEIFKKQELRKHRHYATLIDRK